MKTEIKERIISQWKKYFPKAEMPVAAFYADQTFLNTYIWGNLRRRNEK